MAGMLRGKLVTMKVYAGECPQCGSLVEAGNENDNPAPAYKLGPLTCGDCGTVFLVGRQLKQDAPAAGG